MAAYNAVSSSNNNSASSLTYSHTTGGSNRSLVVSVGLASKTITATVTYAGTSMTDLGHTDHSTTNNRVYLFGLANPATGANNVVVTLTGGSTEIYTGAISATAADQGAGAAAFGTYAGAEASTQTHPTLAVTSATSALVVDGCQYGNDRTACDQTERWHLNPNTSWSASGATAAGAASVTMGWTLGAATTSVLVGISVKNFVATTTIPNKIVGVFQAVNRASTY